MAKYRKKPVVIEAQCWDGSQGMAQELANWIGGEAHQHVASDGRRAVFIPTMEGLMRADAGDWIIRGVKGEFYPCKPDIFAATYEPA